MFPRAPLRARGGPPQDHVCPDLSIGLAERTRHALAAEQAALERERESRHRLTELDRQKTEFISSISHELRTPLTSISGYLELLTDGEAGTLTDQQCQMLSIIDRNSRRLLALLDGLLTLSQMEAGTFGVRMDRVEMRAVLDAVLRAAAPTLADRSLRLTVDVSQDLGVVRGDAVELGRALENVLTNAMKFTSPGGLIAMRARSTLDSVVITVEDTGVGIPDADREKLFTGFFRAGVAQELALQGAGLGLVIVKVIVDCHRGEVSIASTPDCGTTVIITLPRSQPDSGELPAVLPGPTVALGVSAVGASPS